MSGIKEITCTMGNVKIRNCIADGFTNESGYGCRKCGFNESVYRERIQRIRAGKLIKDEETGLRYLDVGGDSC